MFTVKRSLIACLAIAWVAWPALAGDGYWTEGPKPTMTKKRTVQHSPAGRTVAVWRDVSAAPVSTTQQDSLEAPDSPFQDEAEGQMPESSPQPEYVRPGTPMGEWTHESPGCDGDCGACCNCCPPLWAYRSYVFGDFLYLKPTDVDMAHAIQQNGVGGLGTTPDGRVATLHPRLTGAYRVGFVKALSDCSSVGVAYSNFHSHTTDSVDAPDVLGGTVASLVMHPNSINAGSTSSLVDATYDIDFQIADLDYRRVLTSGQLGAVSYTAGVRYAKLSEQFQQIGNFAPPIGTIQTSTNITFEGVGFRTGLDGERRIGASQLSVYAKGFISVLFGRFNSNYAQVDTTTTAVQALSNWANDRTVPILDYEVGINWTSMNGRWRVASGYYTAFWFNTITTPQFVQAVQASNFINLGQTVAFDGLVTRLEYRF